MAKKQVLGRGLSSLISESSIEAKTEELTRRAQAGKPDRILPLSQIHRNKNQPRTNFDEDELNELADSIRQVGVLQPILVRPDGEGYEIVAGERRYQASKRAGLEEIPVVIREIDDEQVLELALIENIQRSNLNPIDEAKAYKDILQRTKITQEELAKRLSKSRSTIANTVRLLDLPEEARDYVERGTITPGHARAVLSLKTEAMREKLVKTIVEKSLSVRQAEELAAALQTPKKEAGRPAGFSSAPYKEAMRQASQNLGAQVAVRAKKDKRCIEIICDDDEELNRIITMLSKGEERA